LTDPPETPKRTPAKKAAAAKKAGAARAPAATGVAVKADAPVAKQAATRRRNKAPAEPAVEAAGGSAAAPDSELAADPGPYDAPPVEAVSTDPHLFRLIAALATVVALLLAGALIYTMIRISDDDNASSLRGSALSAAVTYGTWVSSYNYTDLDAPSSPWSDIEHHSTPSFLATFDKTKSQLSSVVQDYKATATGTVQAAGLASINGSRAVVLLFINQTVTNTIQKPAPASQPLRVEIILTRSGGHWLLDNVVTE
jgi:Mce-associated membrane protein